MLVKTDELLQDALNWAVCQAAGWAPTILSKIECQNELTTPVRVNGKSCRPSERWEYGALIVEEEIDQISRYDTYPNYKANRFACDYYGNCEAVGPTMLIAAMRCYVKSKLGDEVEIPDELL